MADDFAEHVYGTRVRTSEDGRVREMTPQSGRRERVVRCRDRAFSHDGGNTRRWFYGARAGAVAMVEPDGFCAWGEPREGDS